MLREFPYAVQSTGITFHFQIPKREPGFSVLRDLKMSKAVVKYNYKIHDPSSSHLTELPMLTWTLPP